MLKIIRLAATAGAMLAPKYCVYKVFIFSPPLKYYIKILMYVVVLCKCVECAVHAYCI